MAEPTKGVPDGFFTITPHLIVRGADKAIEFYRKAFGAEVQARRPGPDGRIMHAVIRIGDSPLMLCDEYPEWGSLSPEALGGTPDTIHLYVEDADASFDRAVAAGASPKMPVMDAFWGERYGKVVDPFGHEWSLATHKEDLTDAEIDRRAEAFFCRPADFKPAKAS